MGRMTSSARRCASSRLIFPLFQLILLSMTEYGTRAGFRFLHFFGEHDERGP